MFRRLVLTTLAAGCLLPLTGCIDLTQTITLNPDGKGKVVYDMKLSPLLAGGALNLGGPNAKEKTPEEMLQDFAKSALTKKGVTAWKEVSVKWTDEGKMHFVGTAYFENLDDLAGVGGGDDKGPKAPSVGEFVITKEKDVWKIAARKTDNPVAPPNPNPNPLAPNFDPAKATPKEWDEFVLKMRIGYQAMKPFLVMMLTDLKSTTVFKLPGEVMEVQGFKKQRDGAVSHTIDGDQMMAFLKKFMTQDAASWKRVMQDLKNQPVNTQQVMEKLGLPPEMMEPSLTLRAKDKPQFDYAKEVQAARMAYPRLREQLKLDASVKLPGEE